MSDNSDYLESREEQAFLSARLYGPYGSRKVFIHFDPNPVAGKDIEWMGYVLASMARGIARIIIDGLDMPSVMIEQAESRICDAFIAEMQHNHGGTIDPIDIPR